MKNKRISDVVLVYDRYYAKKPNPIALAAKRVGLCCAICVCAMMFVLSEYGLSVNLVLCGVIAALFGAAFSLLFIFVKKRFAIPGILLLFGAVVWLRFESFVEKISCFLEAMCMVMDGRFVSGRILRRIIVSQSVLEMNKTDERYVQGVMFGVVLLIALFALITAAGMFSKPHYLPSFLFWIALWVPVFISERFTFNLWIIPALAVYMGAFAVSIAYKDGLALKSGKNGVYRSSTALNESSFKNSLAKVPYMKRIGMLSAHYSKYFSVTMYAGLIFAVIGILSSVVFSSTEGIDYTRLYDFVTRIGENTNVNPPFEGPLDQYFTNYKISNKLTISSPGDSEMEVLKVSNPGSSSVYLRGDYGINFFGNYWTSPVNSEPYSWKALDEFYRPAEMRVLSGLLQNDNSADDTIEKIDLKVDYLCDSKTVFLPAYTENFNYYEHPQFDTYGDFVVRVNPRYSNVQTIECAAMIPAFTNQDGGASPETLQYVRRSLNAVNNWDFEGVMNRVMMGCTIDEYKSYVYSTFCSSPEDRALIETLDEFLITSGLNVEITDIHRDWELSELEARYRIAGLICGYLRDNYTYSLSNENTGDDAVRTFLNETKRGHCALYATSMTLLLRRLGIPARYVTGFVAPTTGRGSTILRSKNLHAWCEVYMDELGWVTFDPTSSAAFGTPNSNNSGSTVSRTEQSSNDSSESSSTSSRSYSDQSDDDESDDDYSSEAYNSSSTEHESVIDNNNPGSKVNVLPYILVILAVAAAAAIVWLIVRGYKALEARAAKAVRRCCRERKSDVILEKIIMMLKIGGLTPKPGELPEKFYARAERMLRCAFSVNMELLEAVAFGTGNIPQTECEGLARLLEQLYNALNVKLDVFDRIKLWRTML